MTHPIYTQQQLQRKTLNQLKTIYAQLDTKTEVSDKRCKESWVNAIITDQSIKLQKVDNQALAQVELDSYIATQAQAVAPEPLTIVEISFDHHEYYANDKLVASISHDDNHLTIVDTSLAEPVHKYLPSRPLEQLTSEELQQLFNHEVRSQLQELVTV